MSRVDILESVTDDDEVASAEAGAVETAVRSWWVAMTTRDVDALSSIVSDACVFSGGPQGREVGRAQLLATAQAFFADGAIHHWEIDDLRIDAHGDSAVATYTWTEDGEHAGISFHLDGIATDVFCHDVDRWVMIARHVGATPGAPDQGMNEMSQGAQSLDFLSALAGLPVLDMSESVAWYSRFFDRRPDMEPMPDVAEWVLTHAATLQLVTRPETAGTGFTRLEVADLDAAMGELERRGLTPVERGQFDDVVRFADYVDPSGNEVSVVQALFEVTRFPTAPATA